MSEEKKTFTDLVTNWRLILLFVTAIVLTTLGFEARYAKSAYVVQVEQRLDQKITQDRVDNIQNRIWKLEDRYGLECVDCPPVVKDEYRELQKEKEQLENKLESGG